MHGRLLVRWAIGVSALLALSTWSALATAGDLPCIFKPQPNCEITPHVELGMGWGESYGDVGWQWSYRGFVEVGVLSATDLSTDLHWGAVVDVGFDLGRVTDGWTVSPKVKTRYWLGGSPVNLDWAIGPTFERYQYPQGTDSGTRLGLTTDLSLGVYGIVNVYGSVGRLQDYGGYGDSEIRLLAGVRGTMVMWGAILCALSGCRR